MSKKARKTKYNNRKLAEKAALKAMSDYIRERDNYTCFTCGKKGTKYNIDAGHWIPRGYSIWKFDERNVHAQCVYENQYLGGNWPVYYDKMIKKYGGKLVAEILSMKNNIIKRTIQDFNKIEEYYNNKLERLRRE